MEALGDWAGVLVPCALAAAGAFGVVLGIVFGLDRISGRRRD